MTNKRTGKTNRDGCRSLRRSRLRHPEVAEVGQAHGVRKRSIWNNHSIICGDRKHSAVYGFDGINTVAKLLVGYKRNSYVTQIRSSDLVEQYCKTKVDSNKWKCQVEVKAGRDKPSMRDVERDFRNFAIPTTSSAELVTVTTDRVSLE